MVPDAKLRSLPRFPCSYRLALDLLPCYSPKLAHFTLHQKCFIIEEYLEYCESPEQAAQDPQDFELYQRRPRVRQPRLLDALPSACRWLHGQGYLFKLAIRVALDGV
jgi:hypothetical protein